MKCEPCISNIDGFHIALLDTAVHFSANAGRKPPIRKEKGMDKNAPTRESSARMVMGNLTHLADRAEALEKLVLEKLAPVLTCPPKGDGRGGVKSDWPPLWSEAQGHIDRTNNALCAIETLITAAEL